MAYVKISSMTEEVRMDGVSGISVVAMMSYPAPSTGDTWFRVKVQAGDYIWDCPTEFASGRLSFVPDLSLLRGFPESTTAQAVVTVYLENSELGDDFAESDSRTVTLVAFPETAKPVPADGWVTLQPDHGASGYPGGVYVAGSSVKAVFDLSKVQFMYDTYVRECRMKIGSTEVIGESATLPVSTPGEVQVTCTVTDMRGFEAKETFTITVHTYTQPAISGIVIARADASGAMDENGAYILVKADAEVADLAGKNTIAEYYAALSVTGSDAVQNTDLESGVYALLGGNVVPARSYRVVIHLKDTSGGYAKYTAIVPTMSVAFNVKPGGKGAAFGRVAEKDNALDIGDWNLLANGVRMGNVYITGSDEDPNELFAEDGGVWTENTGSLPFSVWQREE